MPYFGVDAERYGGWSEEEKAEALENSELPPDREPREDVEEDGESGAAKRLEPVDGPETDAVKLTESSEESDEDE